MSGKGRKKAAAKMKISRSREPAADMPSQRDDKEVVEAATRPEQLSRAEPSPESNERLQVLRQFVYACGRFYDAMTKWLEHGKWHIRVLGVLTWLVVLGAFSTLVVVVVLKWEPWMLLAAVGGFTGINAVGYWLGSRRGSD